MISGVPISGSPISAGAAGATLQTITCTGIASAEAFGSAAVSHNLAFYPVAIASAESVPAPKLNFIISPTGIASAESIGSSLLILFGSLAPVAIPSAEAFGTPLMKLYIAPGSIPSGETFGGTSVGVQVVFPVAIASAEAFGTPKFNQTIAFPSIASAEAFGTASLSQPLSLIATIDFNDMDEGIFTESADLVGGTYIYNTKPISDTDDVGDTSGNVLASVPNPPEPPTSLAYVSGAAAAVTIGWTASVTALATYRAYLQQVGGFLDLGVIAATAGAGATSLVLPAITGYPGKAYVILRAVSSAGGYEEKNTKMLEIEFDAAGARIAPRPVAPAIDEQNLIVTSGRTVSVRGTYAPEGEPGIASHLQLFERTPTGSYNFATVLAEAALADSFNGLKATTIPYTFSTNGFRYIALKARTAGSVQSENRSEEFLLYVSDENMTSPPEFSATVAKG
jgi:hypothetical protein